MCSFLDRWWNISQFRTFLITCLYCFSACRMNGTLIVTVFHTHSMIKYSKYCVSPCRTDYCSVSLLNSLRPVWMWSSLLVRSVTCSVVTVAFRLWLFTEQSRRRVVSLLQPSSGASGGLFYTRLSIKSDVEISKNTSHNALGSAFHYSLPAR